MHCKIRAEFHGENGFPVSILESDDLKKLYREARNCACEIVNPRFEEWNQSYGRPVNGYDDEEYINYIVAKQNEALDGFFGNLPIKIRAMKGLQGELGMTIEGIPGFVYVTLHEM